MNTHLDRTDERIDAQISVRRWYDGSDLVRADVFVGGWRVASLKTERGVANRVAAERTKLDIDFWVGDAD